MAENDRFENILRAGWRTVAQYVENGNASPEEVDDKIVKSLAKYLRIFNGVPGFQAIADVLSAPSRPSLIDSFAELDDIVRSHKGHRHTKVSAQVAKSILAQQLAGGGTLEPKNLADRLAEDICLALVRHYFFAKVCHPLITKGRFLNHEEFHQWQIGVERSIQPGIGKVAAQLVGNPNTVNLRAPRRITKKVPTSDLLDEVLV